MAHQLALEAGDFVHGLLQQLLLIAGLFQKRRGHGAGIWTVEQAAGLLFYFKLLFCCQLDSHPLTEVHGAIVVVYISTLAKL